MSERDEQRRLGNPEVAEEQFEVNVDERPEPTVTVEETLRTPASGVDQRRPQEPFQVSTPLIDPSALNDEHEGPPIAESADVPPKTEDPEYQARLIEASQDLQAVVTEEEDDENTLEK